MGGFNNPIVGGTALRIPRIQSPNYTPGSLGWAINIDGSAEFNNLTVRGTFLGTNFILNSTGAFFYTGTPAAGNLVASITTNAGTDSFGNTYLGGINTYDLGGEFVGLNVGNLLIGVVADSTKAGVVGIIGGDGMALSSPYTVAHPNAPIFWLQSGDLTATPQSSASYPHHQVSGTVWLVNPAVQATNPGNVWTAETWHTPTFSGTWSSTGTLNGNSTFQGMQYRKDAEDNVWISGGATTTGAGGSIFTLPSGYFHTTRRHLVPCWILHGGVTTTSFAQVTETGVVNIAASITGVTIGAGDQVYINGKFPLGNIG